MSGQTEPEDPLLGAGLGAIKHSSNDTGFVYKPLQAGSIRLLQMLPVSTATDIRCSLHHRELCFERAGDYIALSYCWGDPKLQKTITLDGHDFQVTLSLWEALSSILMHHDSTALFWIDAICIDQKNIPERNEQVYNMWRIYSHAHMVFAWLGPSDESTPLAFRALQEDVSTDSIDQWLDYMDHLLEHLLEHPEGADESSRKPVNFICFAGGILVTGNLFNAWCLKWDPR